MVTQKEIFFQFLMNERDRLEMEVQQLQQNLRMRKVDAILQGLISGLTSGLISLIGSGFGDTEVSEIIEICTSAGTVGTKLLSGIVDIIGFLGALVPFSTVLLLLFPLLARPLGLLATSQNTSQRITKRFSENFIFLPEIAAVMLIQFSAIRTNFKNSLLNRLKNTGCR